MSWVRAALVFARLVLVAIVAAAYTTVGSLPLWSQGLLMLVAIVARMDEMLARSLNQPPGPPTNSHAERRADVLFDAAAEEDGQQGLVPLLTALRGTHPRLIEEMASAVESSMAASPVPKLALPGQKSRNDSALVSNLAYAGELA